MFLIVIILISMLTSLFIVSQFRNTIIGNPKNTNIKKTTLKSGILFFSFFIYMLPPLIVYFMKGILKYNDELII